jgi:capsular exopolysaccharide synthesis family protein
MPGPRRTREQWRALVAEASRSGLTDQTYCEQHGVSLSSFRRWHKIFQEEGAGAWSDPSQSVDPVTVKSHHAVSASAAGETKSIYRRKRTGANNTEQPQAKLRIAKEPLTPEQRLDLAKGWVLSGLSQSEYCERHGISVDDLRHWREVSTQERDAALPLPTKPKRETRRQSTDAVTLAGGPDIESRREPADPVPQVSVKETMPVPTPVSESPSGGTDGPGQSAESVEPPSVPPIHSEQFSTATETKSIHRRKRAAVNNTAHPRAQLEIPKEPATREQWLDLAGGWLLSGLSQSEYCERHGISVEELRHWREVLAQERGFALPDQPKPKREMRASSTRSGRVTAGARIESPRAPADPVPQVSVKETMPVPTPVSESPSGGTDGPRRPSDSVEPSLVPSTHSEQESAAAGIAATPEPADSVQQLWAAAERLSGDVGAVADGFGPELSSEDRALDRPPTMRQSWSDRVVGWLRKALKQSRGLARQAISVDTVRRWRETITPRRGDARSQPADPDREHPKQSGRAGSISALAEGSPTYTRTRTMTLDPAYLRDHRVVTGQVYSDAAEAYKVLRTQVLQRLRANGWRTLGITATRQGHGKTLTALNLAISLAMEVNQTVLLVDLDLRHPVLGRYLSKDNLYGISDYLIGRHDISEILINPGIERLVILPGNEHFINSSEQLSSPRMVQLVNELKSRYPDRIVLFDLPPLLLGDDVMAFAPNLDAIMLVLEEGKTTTEELRRAYELLEGQNIVGTVLNKSVYNVGAPGYGSYS